eukprot:1149155-Pelagomonas_calceolata.AAC.1
MKSVQNFHGQTGPAFAPYVAHLIALPHAENVWGRHRVRTSFTRIALHQGQGAPGTRPGIAETAPNLNGRWNRG